jgi:hypothetical protein
MSAEADTVVIVAELVVAPPLVSAYFAAPPDGSEA